MPTTMRVDDQGLSLTGPAEGSFDVYFGDQHVWSFVPKGRARVPWPHTMRPWLDGLATVSVRQEGEDVFTGEVRFGSGEGEVRFVDDAGIAIMIDKWGLVQRPFSGRGSGVVERMVEVTRQMIDVAEKECGVHPWIAFGTLLGAARNGKVIGHDSDIDLAYLSERTSIVELNREMYALTRALRAAGLKVMNRNGSFLTVVFEAPDGATSSIDLYSCFYVSGLLHESATVRADVPRTAIEPLGTLTFEGAELPAPADPARMLEVSYGPNWRTPDPSFSHRPGPATVQRFDGWFGSLMKFRREWERHYRQQPDGSVQEPTPFGRWVLGQVEPGVHVVDLGAGSGRDVLALARQGHPATAVDYARGSFARTRKIADAEGLDVENAPTNLYDHRSALTQAARLAHTIEGRRAVLAGGLLDSLEERAQSTVFTMLRILLRRGGTAYLEFAHDLGSWHGGPSAGGRRRAVPVDDVVAGLRHAGAAVVTTEPVPARDAEGMARTRVVARFDDHRELREAP